MEKLKQNLWRRFRLNGRVCLIYGVKVMGLAGNSFCYLFEWEGTQDLGSIACDICPEIF